MADPEYSFVCTCQIPTDFLTHEASFYPSLHLPRSFLLSHLCFHINHHKVLLQHLPHGMFICLHICLPCFFKLLRHQDWAYLSYLLCWMSIDAQWLFFEYKYINELIEFEEAKSLAFLTGEVPRHYFPPLLLVCSFCFSSCHQLFF